MSASQSQPVTAQTSLATPVAAPSAAIRPQPAIALYWSDWKPTGVQRDWEKCSMDKESATSLLGSHGERCGEMTEAVAWFNDAGQLRVLVANYDSGSRLILRCSRGNWRINYERHPRLTKAEA